MYLCILNTLEIFLNTLNVSLQANILAASLKGNNWRRASIIIISLLIL